MQVLMNKKEKEQLVITLHQQGMTIRSIAQQVHMSFKDIGTIIKRIDGRSDDPHLSNKSKTTQALHLFKSGKRPIDVAIELDLSASEVHDIQEEYWALNQLYELAFVYAEIQNFLPSFLKLVRILKQSKMLGENQISKLIKYAGHDLPSLENKIQTLSNEVIDLQWKKKDCQNELATLGSVLSEQKKSSNTLQMAIEYKKQILAEWNRKLNASIHGGNNYKNQ